MIITATKKLETLSQKISSLQQAQMEAKDELAAEFLNIIKHTQAFSVDFPTFVGGTLDVISQIQAGKAGDDWHKAGAKFIRSISDTHAEAAPQKEADTTQPDAATPAADVPAS